MANPTVSNKKCPRCGTETSNLMHIDAGMRLALKTTDTGEVPPDVCSGCYSDLAGKVSKGVKLRMEEQAKAKNRQMMWKSRVGLVKRARQLMEAKAYSEAAISYEKYLRVLEITHDMTKGALTPDVFGKSNRSKELTVVTSVYLDLLRIYDTSPAYRARMEEASKKLALFAPYSPIYPDVIKKAENFTRSAKNPDVIKQFLKQSRRNRPRCFIATVVFQYPLAPELIILRTFRDDVLRRRLLGRRFIYFYYRYSPRVAQWLESRPHWHWPVKGLLRIICATISRIGNRGPCDSL